MVFGWWKRSEATVHTRAVSQRLAAPLAINLGIDFGTSFTKVSFRDVGTEESGIVTLGGTTVDAAIIPSVVMIDEDGGLSLGSVNIETDGATAISYLKMRLAEMELSEPLPVVCGMNLNEARMIRALSAWFLSEVIRRARAWVLEHEADRARGRMVQWSANMGVPVEHFDSPAIAVFREVLTVAWDWANGDDIPANLDRLPAAYDKTAGDTNPEKTDFHAIAEIAAAVHSFITSREAAPGIYVYFDIGGGTVDGVVFDYLNQDGERQINFYSGRVAPLGVAAIASQCGGQSDRTEVERSFVKKIPAGALSSRLAPFKKKLQQHVASVILAGKKKDGRNWQRSAIQDLSRPRKTLAKLDVAHMKPLLIFVGGGGAGSTWYQQAIQTTYEEFRHVNAGIPPYELTVTPLPSDLAMNGLDATEFGRFTIAYGLSIPFGEGPEVRLPSRFDDVPKSKPLKPMNVVDYENSKDVFE